MVESRDVVADAVTALGDATDDFGPVFEQHREAMLVIEPEADRIVDANPAAARLLGYDRAALRAIAASALHPGQRPG
ncbi:MAG: PAS domain-containing protein, partial [Methylobacterium sp.]